MIEPGSKVGGKYEVERRLGKGGMGEVWLARHTGLGDRRVAVKFLLNSLNTDMVQRFHREARLASKIRTRHSVEVLDFGEHQGAPYLVMEYLEGQDLRALLDQCGKVEPALALSILAQVARGLQKAHDAGLIHRDIKPENLFLTKDEEGHLLVKILDFGIAKSVEADSHTATGAMIGTVYYMSPEQFQGRKDIDRRTDVWSLACVAYEMLLGQHVFNGTSVLMIGMQILGEKRSVPSQQMPGVLPVFDAWFAKALHPDLSKRYLSAAELIDALGHALAVEGVSAQLAASQGGQSAGQAFASEFSTTALATGALDSRGTVGRSRKRRLAVSLGASAFAAAAVLGMLVWRPSQQTAAFSARADTLATAPSSATATALSASATPQATAPAPPLDQAMALLADGNTQAAHTLLAEVPTALRFDERFLNVENAWADRQLGEAVRASSDTDKFRMLAEVVQSGADDTRRERARTLLDAIPKRVPSQKTKGSAAEPKSTGNSPESDTPPPASTPSGRLPSRF